MAAKAREIIRSTEEERRKKFEQEVDSQHALAVRTAQALRKLVLVSTPKSQKTELADFAKGEIDPQLQLVLMARDEYEKAEDSQTRLGFYRCMRDVLLSSDEKTMEVLKLVMNERHHRENLALKREQVEAMAKKSMTEEELLAIAEQDATEQGADAP